MVLWCAIEHRYRIRREKVAYQVRKILHDANRRARPEKVGAIEPLGVSERLNDWPIHE